METSVQFKWVPFYMAFATKLLEFQKNRQKLIERIQKVYFDIGMKLPKLEKDNNRWIVKLSATLSVNPSDKFPQGF